MDNFFCVLSIVFAVIATAANGVRAASFALWLCSLSTGGVFLAIGAEFLAVAQWTIGTLVGLGFLVYSLLFGDHEGADPRSNKPTQPWQPWIRMALPSVLCICFVGLVWRAIGGSLPVRSSIEAGHGLQALGLKLIQDHLVSLEILTLMLFVVIVGAGVIGRPEVNRK